MIRAAFFGSLLCLAPLAAIADQSDWQDGVYTGEPADFFAGQSPAIIALVKSNDFLARVAVTNLSPCPDDGTQQLCNLNQTRFILDYIAAFYGDLNSQQNVAYFLSGDGMPPKIIVNQGNLQIGVSPAPVSGCAWRIAILISGHPDVSDGDFLNYKEDCEALSSHDQESANTTAAADLVPQIQAQLAHGSIPFSLVDNYPLPPSNITN